MMEIKLIEKDSVLPKLYPMDWDVVINGRPYYVVRIEGFVHTIGGHWGENNLWAYPRDEEPNYENLVEFNSDRVVSWGITQEPHHYINHKYGESEVFHKSNTYITRNGKKFCDVIGGIDTAKYMIHKFSDHPLKLEAIDYDKKMIGRKVWWRSEPAIITNYCNGQACVILEPDGIEKFTVPTEFANEGDDYYCDGNVKVDILDAHVWWFRN